MLTKSTINSGLPTSVRRTLIGVGVACFNGVLASAVNADVLLEENFDSGLGQFSGAGRAYVARGVAFMRGSSGGDGTITSAVIDASGFSDITLSFDRTTRRLDSGESGSVEVSINGGDFLTLESETSASGRATLTLGSDADNASIVIRFSIDASSFFETFAVDNIVLEGDGDGDGDGGDVDDGNDVDDGVDGGEPAPDQEEASCDNLAPGQFDCTVDGRDVNIFVPDSFTGESAVPLVVDMHGFTGTNSGQQQTSGWDDLAREEGFIVAYPQGIGNAWNAQGICCGFSNNVDDEQFIRDVVAAVQNAANIDAGRIFATGLSNGGSMTHTVACESADLFAGAAAVSFGLAGGNSINQIVNDCNPSEPIPVIHFHGTADRVVNFNNGILDSLGARDSLEAWRRVQDCDAEVIEEDLSGNTSCQTHQCPGDVSVSLCTVSGGNHILYRDVDGAGIPRFAWDFFQSQ